MAENILLKLINEEVSLELFKKWILLQLQDPCEFTQQQCSPADFLTYFLNFIHEQVLSENKILNNVHKYVPVLNVKKSDNMESTNNIIDTVNVKKSSSYSINFDKSSETELNDSPLDIMTVSTPKVLKFQAETSLNSLYYSPISPIYKTNNYITPKNKKNDISQNSLDKVSPLCLSDFIVKKNCTKKKCRGQNSFNETPRRITPTCLAYDKTNSFRKTLNSFSNFNIKEESLDNLTDCRNYIVEERLKILTKNNPTDNFTSLSKKLNNAPNQLNEVNAEVSLVTNKKELNRMAEIYTVILKSHLVLNINSEINFLISLLLATKQFIPNHHFNSSDDLENDFKYLDDDPLDFKNSEQNVMCTLLFKNVHNVVYFATKSLELLVNILRNYDKMTLILLSENERIKHYSSELSLVLKKLSEEKSELSKEILDKQDQSNVCFNLDTDNKDNFPNDITFHSFRKQRDLFYDILRIWENNHSSPGWDFSIGLGGKIRSLLSLQSEPANFVYFCRLFKDQLLSSCGKSLKEDTILEENISLLSSLPNVDTNKLNRLKDRLTSKQSTIDSNSFPVFTGYQEFYRSFIIAAANYTFFRHLCDIFIKEIMELNDTKFCSGLEDSEESDFSVDPEVRKSFAMCLRHLRMLAKFLGFVESVPYKSDYNYNCSDHVITMQIKIRKQTIPTFDIKQILLNSIQRNTVILSVPWICKYLSMLDFITLRLPYYSSVLNVLFKLYRTFENPLCKHDYNSSLVKFSLGWLFELPHFPDSEFYNFYMTESDNEEYCRSSRQQISLDSLNIVDQNILYSFCPYLEKIKRSLMTTSLRNTVTIKHITPVTAIHSSQKITKKRTEQQLEESFFNSQPSSVKKTIEFVSERIASSCVKHICYFIVPEYKKKALKDIRQYFKTHMETIPTVEDPSRVILKQKICHFTQMQTSSLKELCEQQASDILKAKIEPAIASLLAIDTLSQTKVACVAITAKMCKERVKQWIATHINTSIFSKELDIERTKFFSEDKNINKPLVALPALGNRKTHNGNCLSAAHLLERLQNLAVDILEKPCEVNKKIVLNTFNQAYETLNGRCDVNECINSNICRLLVDVGFLLVVHNPDVIFSEDVKKHFVESVNTYYGKKEFLFKNLLCPRNIIMMAQPCNDKMVWDHLAKFAALLIKENVLPCTSFESQCTGFYQNEWDKNTLENMSHFLNRFITYYQQDGGDMDHFTLLLQFLSEFCTDL